MVETGSYDNAVPAKALELADEDKLVVSTDDRYFRRPVAPVLNGSRDAMAECNLERGHTLMITKRGIECSVCEAEWNPE
jgi:hypothetical protein